MSILSSIILATLLSSNAEEQLLSDPFLQAPTPTSTHVVWFTEFPGEKNFVEYGDGLEFTVLADTKKLSRMREDSEDDKSHYRDVFRHEATLQGLPPDTEIPYRVVSVNSNQKPVQSKTFTCSVLPRPGTPLKILLTSDHQLKPLVAANIEKVQETAKKIDAIFFSGDLVNRPDKASEWFDDKEGGSFFPVLQGKAEREINGRVYQGAPLLQNAPLYTAIGNHEIMGRFNMDKSLDYQLNDPYPKDAAERLYEELYPEAKDAEAKKEWVKNNSYNSDSYEEIFTLPQSTGGKKYYAETIGDVRLVVLDATRIWRSPKDGVKGKYSESKEDLHEKKNWGYGEFIFESIAKGSPQYEWLQQELQSEAFQNAQYKIVMFHNPMHSLGDNIVPPFTDPEAKITQNEKGEITAINYEYPIEKDVLIRDIEPLLIQYGVQLVFYGHDHIWNRFKLESGLNYLETSNVGNTNGAYLDKQRTTLAAAKNSNYAAEGDPNGLHAIMPTIAPLKDAKDDPIPYISSNEITVFSILDTGSGAIDSYYFDTTKPDQGVVHFDQFQLR